MKILKPGDYIMVDTESELWHESFRANHGLIAGKAYVVSARMHKKDDNGNHLIKIQGFPWEFSPRWFKKVPYTVVPLAELLFG